MLGTSLALLLSLWAGKTHEALLGTYAVWGVWLLWSPIMGIVRLLFPSIMPPPLSADPFWLAFAPYYAPKLVAWEDYAWFLGTTWGISAILIFVAVLRVRAIVTRDVVKRRSTRSLVDRLREKLARGRYVPAPSLDWNPVFWREWHRSKPSRWAHAVNILYFAVAAVFSLTVVATKSAAAAPWINAFQVTAGLLVLSVTASASLAEERARGSLDLLMTTMLSTPQILLGKWLGTYRAVPLLAVLPAIVGFGFTYDEPDRWPRVLLIIFYVLCAGAAITSLGLALATWLPRVGSAVAATVSVYVAITAGWVFLMLMLQGAGSENGPLMASPFVWVLIMTLQVTEPRFAPPHVEGWWILWLLVLAFGALGLLIATLANFDRKLGRAESQTLAGQHDSFPRRERIIGISCIAAAMLATAVAILFDAGWTGPFVLNGAQVSVCILAAAVAAALSSGRQVVAHRSRIRNSRRPRDPEDRAGDMARPVPPGRARDTPGHSRRSGSLGVTLGSIAQDLARSHLRPFHGCDVVQYRCGDGLLVQPAVLAGSHRPGLRLGSRDRTDPGSDGHGH